MENKCKYHGDCNKIKLYSENPNPMAIDILTRNLCNNPLLRVGCPDYLTCQQKSNKTLAEQLIASLL
ncbi:MAG: hypothetical protein WCX73_03585 [Candidatus Pacearchaeota archaeon]|jgi:hypothetical protein